VNTIPGELIAVPKWHGYFWHPTEKIVYSLKVGGVLKPLKFHPAYRNDRLGICVPAGFQFSKRGKKFRMAITILRELKPYDYKVPYAHETGSRI
jgi:hypothetical protein